jgi:Zn-dependent M16 (insulinase) family peptidase
LANIKAHLAAKEPYFESLIRRYFLENLHRATVILTPDPNLAAVQAEAEAGRVKAVLASLPETKRAAHAAKAERLQALQQIARQA